jgi:DNA end-binding protein Ku
MARAIYKASIRFGSVHVPVKLYSAVEERGVHFRLLHAADGVPITQQMLNAATAASVPRERIRKAYQLDQSSFVLLRPEELAHLEPEPSRDITITRFIDPELISPVWYERPYYTGPDGDAEAYFALVEALAHQRKQGIAHWVMRKKRYVGVLRVRGDYLVLMSLHQQTEELASLPALRPPAEQRPDPKQRKLAEQLVAALEAPFEPEIYRDTYRERVLELVATKARGGRIEPKHQKRERPKGTLADSLRRSIATAKEQRVA